MINVMVVEDEPPIMRVITKFIESFPGDFKVTHTAMNGKKALELLQSEPVEVVFTDVKMPVMDGLELSEHIRQQMPDTIIVVISGYQDFQYARKALQFQVYDYLLKPVSQENINTVLDKIQNELQQRYKEQNRIKMINSIHNENYIYETDQAAECRYGVFLLCAGAFPLIPNDSMLPSRTVWENINIEKKIETLLPGENTMSFKGKSASEMVIVFEADDQEIIKKAAKELISQLKQNSFLPVTLVSSNQSVMLSEISQLLKKLRDRLYKSIRLFTSQIIWEDIAQDSVYLDTRLIEETIYSAAKADEIQLGQSLLTALMQFIEAGLSQLQIVAFFNHVVTTIYLKSSSLNKDTSSLKMDLDIAISNAVDDKSLAKDIAFIILESGSKELKLEEKSDVSHIAKNIETYLQNNYQQSITTNMLSKKFGFVPSYISKLFRAYKGISPSEYLTHFRIEKSKQIMLDNPELLWKEVAQMVGFSDQYHFSKTFKKQTGMWPTEYVIKKQ